MCISISKKVNELECQSASKMPSSFETHSSGPNKNPPLTTLEKLALKQYALIQLC